MQAINKLSDAVYPPGAITDWGLAQIECAPQTVRAILSQDEHLVCHVGALIRCALVDGRSVQVGGIGGVMTAPESHRRGYAQAALAAMRAYLVDDKQVSFSWTISLAKRGGEHPNPDLSMPGGQSSDG